MSNCVFCKVVFMVIKYVYIGKIGIEVFRMIFPKDDDGFRNYHDDCDAADYPSGSDDTHRKTNTHSHIFEHRLYIYCHCCNIFSDK